MIIFFDKMAPILSLVAMEKIIFLEARAMISLMEMKVMTKYLAMWAMILLMVAQEMI